MENKTILFNDNWQFTLMPIGTALADMSGVLEWHDVEIPHDWLIGDTRDLYRTGEGWYKKNFTLNEDEAAKQLFIIFEGVYMNCTVYVNGRLAGEWKYGYSSFCFDITGFVTASGNTVIVKVCHESPNSRWYSGAGIYRSVRLRFADSVHVTHNGIYVSTKRDTAVIETEVRNNAAAHSHIEIGHTIYDAQGKALASGSEVYLIAAGGRMYDSQHFMIEAPHYWSVETPYLYTLETRLFADGRLIEQVRTRYGYRDITYSPENGFVLNGKTVKLQGVCQHHDLGALGSAMNHTALKRQLTILKSMGVNAIRTSHNMPSVELMELCDEMGFLVDSEAFDMWEGKKTDYDYARFFPEWYEKDVAAWVKRDRNHPSLIMWSIGNEIYDTHKDARGLEVAKLLREAVWKNDPHENASCTIGSNYMQWENAQRVADELKLAGYNYAESLYDEQHEKHPDWFIYGSETVSAVRSRGIYHLPANVPLLTHDDRQCSDMGNSVAGWGRAMESAWAMDRDRPWCGGQFIWTGFDYIGEPTPYNTKNSYFGAIDTAGFPKDAYYFYKSVWTSAEDEPFVHLLPNWDWNEGQTVSVYTYSNLEDIELLVNGESLGKKRVDLLHASVLHAEWETKYHAGEITAKAYDKDGNVVATDTRRTPEEPEKLLLKADRVTINADGRDMAFVEISVLDKDGNEVDNARNRVNVTVSGAGRLVGLDNGDSTDYDSYKGNSRRLFSGKLLAMIEATFESGEITLHAESKGLEEATLKLSAIPCEKPEGITVADAFPLYIQPNVDELPVRRLELTADRSELTKENPTAAVKVRLLPENASYSDIAWRCVFDSGVEATIADISGDNNGAAITAKGDGHFRVRAMCANGTGLPQIISDLEMTVSGLGEALKSPYKFISASLSDISNMPLNIVERGAVSGIKQRTIIGFANVDFGSYGSDKLLLSVGNAGGAPIEMELWDGNPDKGGSKLRDISFPLNGLWDRFAPESFPLNERLCGIHELCFVVSTHCIFGGFEFEKLNKAFAQLAPTDNSSLYGDEYKVEASRITGIGNNVLISFTEMDFGEGATSVVVCGRTANALNTIQLRYTGTDGIQKTQLLEFEKAEDYTERRFTLDKIAGMNDISFVFLPGSSFDFDWFEFE